MPTLLRLANRRAKDLQTSIPKAIAARYDREGGRIVICLSSKLDVSFSPHDAQGLENAKPSQLGEIEITPSGFGIHFRSWTQTSTCRPCWRVF